jgi:hypothetical protein
MTLSCVSAQPHIHFRTIPIHVLNVLWETHCPRWHCYVDCHVQRWKILPHQFRQCKLKRLLCSKICVHMCDANCDLICLSLTVSFWTTCNLYVFRRKLFRRVLWTVVCHICNSALVWEIDFFGLCTKACLTQSITLSDFFSTLPVSLNRLYHLLTPLPTGGFTPYSHLNLY